MFKRVGVLAMMLVGGLAVLTPAVAQASERDDYRRYERHEDRREVRRDWDRRDFGRGERRDWRERERFERRDYRPVYNYGPTYYDRYGNPYSPR
jgi:hypothetical protein